MEQPLDFSSAGSKKRKLDAPELSPSSSDALMGGAGDEGAGENGAGNDVITRVSLHHAPSGMSSPDDSGREMSPRDNNSPQSSLHVQVGRKNVCFFFFTSLS